MARFRFTTHVAAPPDQVFDLWNDLDRLPEWIEGLTKITDLTGPPDRVGARYTAWFGPMRYRNEVLDFERPRSVRTRFDARLMRGEMAAAFQPEGDGTRVRQEFVTEGLIPAIVGRIFATGSYKGSFRGELETFRRIAEREARDGSRP